MMCFIGFVIGFFCFRYIAPAIGFRVVSIKDSKEDEEKLRTKLLMEYDQRLYLEVLKETLKERVRSLEEQRVELQFSNEREYQRLGEVIQRVEARIGTFEKAS